MTASVVGEQPPSPPISNDGDLGLSAVQRHVASLEKRAPPRSIRQLPVSVSDLEIVSIPPVASVTGWVGRRPNSLQDPYGDPSMYQTGQNYTYYPVQPVRGLGALGAEKDMLTWWAQTFERMAHPHTPPTTGYDASIATRSGRALGSPLDPNTPQMSRRSRSPRPKKAPKAGKAGKATGPLISQPLSVLTKGYTIPVKDMEAWVNRPVETRLEEAEKKNGHIARPMNSFMLYRSAYADRVKQYCRENNHQVVSQVSGASWPMEPKEIREMYEKYASIERDNHHAAHPDYKFAPNKNGSARKRKDFDDSDDDDSEWGDSRRGGKRAKGEDSRSHSSTPFEPRRVIRHPLDHYNASSYQINNPYGRAPAMPGPDGYYQQQVTQYDQQVEDVRFRPIENPFPTPQMTGSLIGLPDGTEHDILGSQSRGPPPMDPRLLQYDPKNQYVQYGPIGPEYGTPATYVYGPPPTLPEYSYPRTVEYHPGMATLTDGAEVWAQQGQIGADFDDEFQNWAG